MANPTRHEGPEPNYDRVVSGYATFHHPGPFRCDWGGELPQFTLAYETWGTLSAARDKLGDLEHRARAIALAECEDVRR